MSSLEWFRSRLSLRAGLFWLICAAPLFGQAPVIPDNGIVNAASYTHPLLPGGALAQGTLFTIFGSNLGPTLPAQNNVYPIPATLAGVTIKVGQGTNVVSALPFYVSATQVSAIMPSNAPLGADTVTLTYNGQASNAAAVTVVTTSVGIFTANSGGTGPSVLQNYVSPTETPVNTRTITAKPGQPMILYGTGLGAALNADNQPPTAGNLAPMAELWVGGISTPLAYSGRSPCCSGLDQWVFNIPANAPLGCNVPIVLRTGGNVTSNIVTAAITADNGACSDAVAPLGKVTTTAKSGSVALVRTTFGTSPTVSVTNDLILTTFRKENGGDFAFNPFFSLPPRGSCTLYTAKGNLFGTAALPGFQSAAGSLTTGVMTIGNGKTTLTSKAALNGEAVLGSSLYNTLFLDGTSFTVQNAGSLVVGPFSTTISPSPLITWTNLAQTSTVTRSIGYTATWSFAGSATTPSQVVIIMGGNYDPQSASSALFYCAANAADGTFTVPAYILGRIPATGAAAAAPPGMLIVGALPITPSSTFTAVGLDAGSATFGSANVRPVRFQ